MSKEPRYKMVNGEVIEMSEEEVAEFEASLPQPEPEPEPEPKPEQKPEPKQEKPHARRGPRR